MNYLKSIGIVLALFSIAAGAPQPPLALIYKGPGSCSTEDGDAGESGFGCSEASAVVAELAGFRYQFVGPNDSPDFSRAKVWVQPGGKSNLAYARMSTALKNNLKKFVKNGGGYVGYCAGAFLATDWFGMMNASSDLYRYKPARRDVGYAFLTVNWNGESRKVYFEGGPYIHNIGPGVEVTATFASGAAAAARSHFGAGRVYVAGPHPEAPGIWSEEDGIYDPDGLDLDLAAEMMIWAAKL